MVLEQEATGGLGELCRQQDLFIDGGWVPGSGGDRTTVIDPATGAQIASVAALARGARIERGDSRHEIKYLCFEGLG